MKLALAETGHLTMTIKSKISLISKEILSIQASLNGLSFCVLDITQNEIIFFKELIFEGQKKPLEIEKILVNEFKTNLNLQKEFKKVNLIHYNNLCTFVPKGLFDENKLVDYLKFDNKIFESDFVVSDEVNVIEAKAVYVPFVNLNNFFFECFGSFEYYHANVILLNKILNQPISITENLYCNVSNSTFELIYIKEGKLNLYNSFQYNTTEDFIYYILFSIEQLKLDTESIKLVLLGNIKVNDTLYSILYKFIRNVSFWEESITHVISEKYKEKINNYNHFSLLNSF
jgi:hypothetical protein